MYTIYNLHIFQLVCIPTNKCCIMKNLSKVANLMLHSMFQPHGLFHYSTSKHMFRKKKVLLRAVTHHKLIVLKITLLTVHKQNREKLRYY